MADQQKICETGKRGYDSTDAEAVERRTEQVNIIGDCCTRCRTRPRCYMCTGMFCTCHAH